MIDRVTTLGSLKAAKHFRSAKDEVRWLIAMDSDAPPPGETGLSGRLPERLLRDDAILGCCLQFWPNEANIREQLQSF
jgi:hypothetical protein